MRLFGFDCSNWSDIPNSQQVSVLLTGHRETPPCHFSVIGLQNSYIARAQQYMFRGLPRREYYLDRPGRNLTIPEQGTRVWIDVEPGCFESRDEFIRTLDNIESSGLKAGIYCNESSYRPVFGDDETYSYLPLWYADYREHIPRFSEFPAFNGWTRPTIWQYRGTTSIDGFTVDLNVWEDQMVELNMDGTDRIESRDGLIYVVKDGIDVLRIGGDTPGQVAKRFGDTWMCLRGLLDGDPPQWAQAPYWSPTPGD